MYIMKTTIMHLLQPPCFVRLQLTMFTKFAMTFFVPKNAPFIHLLLYFIRVIISGGASVKALASGTYASSKLQLTLI